MGTARVVVFLDEDLWHRTKVRAAEDRTSARKLVEVALARFLKPTEAPEKISRVIGGAPVETTFRPVPKPGKKP